MSGAEVMVRKTVSLPATVWARVEEIRWSEKAKSESDVVRRLVEVGLAQEAPSHPKPRARTPSLPRAPAPPPAAPQKGLDRASESAAVVVAPVEDQGLLFDDPKLWPQYSLPRDDRMGRHAEYVALLPRLSAVERVKHDGMMARWREILEERGLDPDTCPWIALQMVMDTIRIEQDAHRAKEAREATVVAPVDDEDIPF